MDANMAAPRERTKSYPGRRRTFTVSSGRPLEPGTLVWVQDREGDQVWLRAEVLAIEPGGSLQVRTDGGEERSLSGAQNLLRCNGDTWNSADGLTGVNDLSTLTHLHEPEVLQALQLRFDVDKIYTFCGPILIALNPFKLIEGLYDNTSDASFKAAVKPLPHIYSVASRAYTNLASNNKSQVVLISGESGAGKTETTKHVLKFLTESFSTSGNTKDDSSPTVSPMSRTRTLEFKASTEKKVLSSNPLLEAFGNACTTRNNNSSRFGKFIELQFVSKAGRPSFKCAAIDTYLLEKVRITEIQQQERSFHVFYQACAASQSLSEQERAGMPLELFGPPQDFAYLRKSTRTQLEQVDDAEEFESTRQSMDAMDISAEEQAQIIRVVAAVLRIGNIELREAGSKVEVVSNQDFQVVCEILGIQQVTLTRALTHRLITVSASESYDSPLSLKQSEDRRESFARVIYSYLFEHIVHRVNESLAGQSAGGARQQGQFFIGVLDIFGFEHFKVNSFEQLCINFANERLQQMFNHFVFEVEMQIYKAEEITCDFSDFPDNQGIIDLIQAKSMSIFTLLDEEGRMPKGSDKSLVQKLWKTFEKHPNFKIEQRKPQSFTIQHFAGPVSYDAANFLDKNMDELGELLKMSIDSSSDSFLKDLMQQSLARSAAKNPEPPKQQAGRSGGKLKPHTVCLDFKAQLESLVVKMSNASPHFVRCIKPNPAKVPDSFERPTVVEQLRSGGVIEALNVQRAGFPCRMKHKSCWTDNLNLIFKSEKREKLEAMPLEARLKEALQELSKELKWSASNPVFAIGKTTVFFKQAAFEAIEGMRIAVLSESAKTIQCFWRRYTLRCLFLAIRARAISIQACVRRYSARTRLWRSMKPGQRRRSKIFRNYLKNNPGLAAEFGEPDSEEEREAAAEKARQDALQISRQEQERQRREEEERRRQEEEEEQRRMEEERVRQEAEAEERRKEQERQRMEQARREAVEEERTKAQEAQALAEARWQEERAALQRAHQDEVRTLQAEAASARDAAAAAQNQHSAELQRFSSEADRHKAEAEQQATLQSVREQESQSRIQQLEQEVERLRKNLEEQASHHAASVQELEAAHRNALALAAETQEEQRTAYLRQMEEQRRSLDEKNQLDQKALLAQEQEHQKRYQEELHILRDREAAQRARHEQEVAELRTREDDRQRNFQEALAKAQRSTNDADLERTLLLEQVQDFKAEAVRCQGLLETQQEELKRVHLLQVEILEQRLAERERTWQREAGLLREQKESQVTSLTAQLEFQRTEMKSTAEQEVLLMRQGFEQRERSLQQMLEQAQLAQKEATQTVELQMDLRHRRQEELLRASEAKAQALEESAKRQQELYERHVAQLNQQMMETQETFRSQLRDAQSENDKRLQESTANLQLVQQNLKAESERARAEVEQEREDNAVSLAQAAEAQQRCAGLQQTVEDLRKQLLQARMKLLDRPRAQQSLASVKEEKGSTAVPMRSLEGRRSSDPAMVFGKQVSIGGSSRRPSVRSLLVPPKLSTMAAAKLKNDDPQAGGNVRRPLKRRATFSLAHASAALAGDVSSACRKAAAGEAVSSTRTCTSQQRASPLRPTLLSTRDGSVCKGAVAPWQDISSAGPKSGKPSDGAVTVLCFRPARPDDTHELLAVGCKSGALSAYRILRTALEKGLRADQQPAAVSEKGQEVETLMQFQAHAKAITSMCFCDGGDQLLTTSSDWTVRLFCMNEGGRSLGRWVDSSLVVCAVSLPRPSGALVMANANSVLRLQELSGRQQKVRLDHYARSLLLALDGTRLLAGTSRGQIHSFAVGEQGLERMGGQQVGQAALTCLVLAPCPDAPPLLAANSMDNTVCLLQANTKLTNFTVLRRLSNPHRLLPLRSCHLLGFPDDSDDMSGPGAGFLASGSEDGTLRVFDLESFSEHALKGHAVPVVDVTVSSSAGLMASGDVHGRVVLWRRGASLAPG